MRYLYALIIGLIASTALAGPPVYYTADGTSFVLFTNTVGTNGAPITVVSETVDAYKDGTATAIGGVTIDDDAAITGQHKITIDLTDADWVTGSTYTVYYSAGTADSISVIGRDFAIVHVGPIDANVTQVDGAALDTHDAGQFPADIRMLLGTAPTEGAAGRLAAAFTKFFDKASPTGTINSLADAVPGAAGGGFIAGSNAATTAASLTISDGLVINRSTAGPAISATGNTTGAGMLLTGGATGKPGLEVLGGTTNAPGMTVTGTGTGNGATITSGSGATGNALRLTAASIDGTALFASGAGTGSGVQLFSGTGANAAAFSAIALGSGNSDGIQAVGGAGVPIRADITGSVTGNLSGSVGSVTGAVGNVTGAVGSVTGAVGSVGTGGIATTSFAAGAIDNAAFNVTENAFVWNAAWDAEVQSEADDALRAIFLQKLFAEDYDPATDGGGVATAWANELTESNAGVTRYTAAALALAPSGGGGGSDPWLTDLPGAYAGSNAGKMLSDVYNFLNGAAEFSAEMDAQGYTAARAAFLPNLDVAVSSRMATFSYTAPLSAAQTESEVNDALVALNLDHLVFTAASIPAITEGTYLDQMMDDGTQVYSRATDSMQAIRDRGDAAWVTGVGGVARPVNQVPVPMSRTWTLKPTAAGLVGELQIVVKLGDGAKIYSIDFRNDLANNGRLLDVNSATITTGTAGGVTFGANLNNVNDYGVDRSQAKVRMVPVTAGTYVLRVSVDYDDSDGGGTAQGDVHMIVVP